jgi:spore coat protein U-like protein
MTASIRAIAAAALLAVLSTGASAGDTQSLTVNANVSGTCKLTVVPALTFTLDPSNTTSGTASTAVQYKCTKGLSAGAFAVGGVTNGTTGYGANVTHATLTETMAYTINWTTPGAFTGSGFGSGSLPATVTLNGAILPAVYQNASSGAYAGAVNITIAP